MLFKDVRDVQILFLCLFLFLGVSTRDWTLQPDLMLATILSCVFTQLLLSAIATFSKDSEIEVISSLRSALITALGLCLLLRSNDYSTMAIAGCLAIASKFLFRFRGKHFYNPSNFGIIAALTLTNNAWVSPGQWGTDWWYLLLFLGAGGIVLNRVGRWDTSAVFLLTYAGLEALRTLWLGWSWNIWQHQLMNGSLLLFALFMLTDPRSIPNAHLSRFIWAIAIAVLSFILKDYFYISSAIIWSLFVISPVTIWLDSIWKAPRFVWKFELNRGWVNEIEGA
jgi:Na+-transporting NADH:ubiquinone oxidoreductase subunit NqrB